MTENKDGLTVNQEHKDIFCPHPRDRADLIWMDKTGGLYHVHSQILANRSRVFRDLPVSKDILETEYDRNVLLSFFFEVYGMPEVDLPLMDLRELWLILHRYEIPEKSIRARIRANWHKLETANVYDLINLANILHDKEIENFLVRSLIAKTPFNAQLKLDQSMIDKLPQSALAFLLHEESKTVAYKDKSGYWWEAEVLSTTPQEMVVKPLIGSENVVVPAHRISSTLARLGHKRRVIDTEGFEHCLLPNFVDGSPNLATCGPVSELDSDSEDN
jgi:hypothetical protein